MKTALAAALTFGLLTLWVPGLWPFLVVQALILPAAALLYLKIAKGVEPKYSPWLLLPFAMCVIGLLQMVAGTTESLAATRQATLQWFTHASAALLAFRLMSDERTRPAALRNLVALAAAVCLAGIAGRYTDAGRAFGLFATRYSDLVFGPFVYHNKAAQFAELLFPAAVWLALEEPRRRPAWIGAAVLIAGSVLVSGSRAGLVILALETMVIALWTVRRQRAALAAPVAVALGAAIFGWEAAARRLTLDVTQDLRLPIFASSLEMASRYWTFGSGLGSWNLVYPEFARFDVHLFINQAHCDWLQWLIEGGVAAPLILLAMLAITLRAARREWWTLGLAFVWLHALVDYPMQQTPAFVTWQLAFWGAAVAVLSKRSDSRGTRPLPVV